MSWTEPALARRIDRAAGRAHRHHRFAHHPLCEGYAHERLRVGRYELCRGCTLAVAGALLGLAVGAARPPATPTLVLTVACTGAGVGLLALVRRLPWGGKTASRLLPAAAAAWVVVEGVRRGDGLGLALAGATVGLVLAGIALYRRRGPWRGPCHTCPELEEAPCSGYRSIRRRERAFQRLTARWLLPPARPAPADRSRPPR